MLTVPTGITGLHAKYRTEPRAAAHCPADTYIIFTDLRWAPTDLEMNAVWFTIESTSLPFTTRHYLLVWNSSLELLLFLKNVFFHYPCSWLLWIHFFFGYLIRNISKTHHDCECDHRTHSSKQKSLWMGSFNAWPALLCSSLGQTQPPNFYMKN